ncbi:Rhodanese-like domain-containing protein 8 [Citrus sinensis]|uniref:Rhodanese-like domain-containing protein 8 n=1 Tax=Citrus sinensis TaxID=2711 RepID=A0ACB8M5H4_CITSI|nr:Rhodanese-like domain-containing protein 8 [Citrus sinensis]
MNKGLMHSGPSRDALAYVEWLREDENFSDLLVQICPALNGHAFPKLKLRYKPSLVQLEGGISHLPLLDPSMRAIPLAPSEWRNKLEAGKDIDKASNSDLNRDFILLDVRNGYEWDIGHFHGARRPDVDCFRSTSFGLSQREAFASDPLADLDKEKTDILMYCTGGIRCDVYSTILRQRGFHNLYALKGGVSHYLENEGPVEWVGNLFVFDSRLSLPPSAYKPDAVSEARMIGKVSENPFATCYICSSQVRELRHRNCANLDCNLLFLCCADCVKNLRGCCCLNCTTAPQRRPVLPGYQRYKKWHLYRDSEVQSQLTI